MLMYLQQSKRLKVQIKSYFESFTIIFAILTNFLNSRKTLTGKFQNQHPLSIIPMTMEIPSIGTAYN